MNNEGEIEVALYNRSHINEPKTVRLCAGTQGVSTGGDALGTLDTYLPPSCTVQSRLMYPYMCKNVGNEFRQFIGGRIETRASLVISDNYLSPNRTC